MFIVALLALCCRAGVAMEPFPFGEELLLDAEPMQPGKRMPILMVEQDGNANVDLWCRTVQARMEISAATIKFEAGPLPEDLPAMQSAGQCTPERMLADEQLLSALSKITDWRWEEGAIVLSGPTTMKFRPATN
jgi:hypothetical protein